MYILLFEEKYMTKKYTEEELKLLPKRQRNGILKMREYYSKKDNREKNKIYCKNRYYKKNGNKERLKKQRKIKEECFLRYSNGNFMEKV